MTEFETSEGNVVSPTEEGEPIHVGTPLDHQLDDPVVQVDTYASDEQAETLPTSIIGSIEEITAPDIVADNDEAVITDGFPVQSNNPHMNGSVTQSLPTPATDEGFEELVLKEEQPKPDKKDVTLKSPLALWMMQQNIHPQLIRLIYWEEIQRTMYIFGGMLFLLLSLHVYSLIGVVTTFALSLLVVAFLYRIGMTIVKAVQKTSAEHPFKHLLEEKIEISEETIQKLASDLRLHINERIRQAQYLFLVKDTVASLKAMVMFWLVSYVAGCITLLTLCIMAMVVVFTIPKLYEEKQAQIDQLFSVVMSKSCKLYGMIEQKLPEKIKIYLKKDKKD